MEPSSLVTDLYGLLLKSDHPTLFIDVGIYRRDMFKKLAGSSFSSAYLWADDVPSLVTKAIEKLGNLQQVRNLTILAPVTEIVHLAQQTRDKYFAQELSPEHELQLKKVAQIIIDNNWMGYEDLSQRELDVLYAFTTKFRPLKEEE